jgi:hypothetical protein
MLSEEEETPLVEPIRGERERLVHESHGRGGESVVEMMKETLQQDEETEDCDSDLFGE